MGMTDQSTRNTANDGAGGFSEIEAVIDRARTGGLAEDAAFEAIARIVEKRMALAPAETYQKPWG